MVDFQFADDNRQTNAALERSTHYLQLAIRALGVFLMLFGLWVGIKVITEAWSLYKQPDGIEYFASAIERGSNLDQAMVPLTTGAESGPGIQQPAAVPFRLSYFAAWIIAILLLLLVGRLAIAAIRVGGELALYDVRIKTLARELVRSGGQLNADRKI